MRLSPEGGGGCGQGPDLGMALRSPRDGPVRRTFCLARFPNTVRVLNLKEQASSGWGREAQEAPFQ